MHNIYNQIILILSCFLTCLNGSPGAGPRVTFVSSQLLLAPPPLALAQTNPRQDTTAIVRVAHLPRKDRHVNHRITDITNGTFMVNLVTTIALNVVLYFVGNLVFYISSLLHPYYHVMVSSSCPLLLSGISISYFEW